MEVKDITDKILQYMDHAEAFAGKEAPLYVDELLRFEFWRHVTTGVFFVALLGVLIGVFLFSTWASKNMNNEDLWGSVCAFSGVVMAVVFLISLFMVPSSFVDAYKVKHAPRVYVIDYIKNSTSCK